MGRGSLGLGRQLGGPVGLDAGHRIGEILVGLGDFEQLAAQIRAEGLPRASAGFDGPAAEAVRVVVDHMFPLARRARGESAGQDGPYQYARPVPKICFLV